MLSGEPFVMSYLRNVEDTILSCGAALDLEVTSHAVVDGHVRMWRLTHS